MDDEEKKIMILRRREEDREEGRRRDGLEESHKDRNNREDAEERESRSSWTGRRRTGEEEEGFSHDISGMSSFSREAFEINSLHHLQPTQGSFPSSSSSFSSGSPFPSSSFSSSSSPASLFPSSTSLSRPSVSPSPPPWVADFTEKDLNDNKGELLLQSRLEQVDESVHSSSPHHHRHRTSLSRQEESSCRSSEETEHGSSFIEKKEEEPLHVGFEAGGERSGSNSPSALLFKEKEVRQKEEDREGRLFMEDHEKVSSSSRSFSSSSSSSFSLSRFSRAVEERQEQSVLSHAGGREKRDIEKEQNLLVAPNFNRKEQEQERTRNHSSSSSSSSSFSRCHPSVPSASSPLVFSISISTPPDVARSPLSSSSPRSLDASSSSSSSSSSSPSPRQLCSSNSQQAKEKETAGLPYSSSSCSLSPRRDKVQEKSSLACCSSLNSATEEKSCPTPSSTRGAQKEDEEEKAFFFLHDGDIEQGLPKDMRSLMNSLSSSSSPPSYEFPPHQLSEILISGSVEDEEEEDEEEEEEEDLVYRGLEDLRSEEHISRKEQEEEEGEGEEDVGREEESKKEKKSVKSMSYLPWKRETGSSSEGDKADQDHEKMRKKKPGRRKKKKKKGDEKEERERRGEDLLFLSPYSESASSASVSTTTSWASSFSSSSPPPSSPCFSSSSSLSTTSSPSSLVDEDAESSSLSSSSLHLLRHSNLLVEDEKEEESKKETNKDDRNRTSQPSVRLLHVNKRRPSCFQTSSLSPSSSSSSSFKLSNGDSYDLKSRWQGTRNTPVKKKTIPPSAGSLKHPSDSPLSPPQKLLHPSSSFSSSSSDSYSASPFEKTMLSREKMRRERERKESLLRIALRIQQDGVVKSIVRRRLLQRYTLLLKQSQALKEKVRKHQDQADLVREALVQFLSIGSKLRSLQQSECWKKYIGAPIHDVDEELGFLMGDFEKSKADSTCFDFSEEEILKVSGDQHPTTEEEEEEEDEEENSYRMDSFYDEKGRSFSGEEEEEERSLRRSSLRHHSSSSLLRCCCRGRSLRSLALKFAPSVICRYFLSRRCSRGRRDEEKKFVVSERKKDYDEGEKMRVLAAEEAYAGKMHKACDSERRMSLHPAAASSSRVCYTSLLIGLGRNTRKKRQTKGASSLRKVCFSAFLLFLLLFCAFILWIRYSIHR